MNLAYQDFCSVIRIAAKDSISRGYRNNHMPCWNAECENLYRTFLQSPEGSDSSRATTALPLRLDKKRRDRWSKVVQSLDFSHSIRKAWSILNNLTGRSLRSPRHCAVSAKAIASQLIRNGRYLGINRESSHKKCQMFGGPLNKSSEYLLKFYFSGVCCCPQTLETRKSSSARFYLPAANNPCWSYTEVLVRWLPFFLPAPPKNSKSLEKSTGSGNP